MHAISQGSKEGLCQPVWHTQYSCNSFASVPACYAPVYMKYGGWLAYGTSRVSVTLHACCPDWFTSLKSWTLALLQWSMTGLHRWPLKQHCMSTWIDAEDTRTCCFLPSCTTLDKQSMKMRTVPKEVRHSFKASICGQRTRSLQNWELHCGLERRASTSSLGQYLHLWDERKSFL